MPDTTGPQLARALHARHPDMPVLSMSGRTNSLLDLPRTP